MGFDNTGKALAAMRRQRRLTQGQFAALCGNGRSQVSRYEAGKEVMKLGTLEKLLACLCVEPEDFFRLLRSMGDTSVPRRQPVPPSHEDHRLADAFCNLHAAIDDLRQVVEASVGPAARLATLIAEAAGRDDAVIEKATGRGDL